MRRSGPPQKGDWFRIESPRNAVAGEPEGDSTKVYIYDEIGFWGTTAEDFVQQLMLVTTDKIELHLNTPGGDMFDGLAIFNALKQHSAEVTTYVDALAASAGSYIALAGDKVIMARNATMMIHDASAMAWGNAADMREMADLLDGFSDNIADIYARKAGGTADEWRGLMKEETWYTAKEAVASGLADEMTDPDEEAEEATNAWDLSVYAHAGREKAESPFRVRERVRLMNNSKEAPMGRGPSNTSGTPEATPAEQTGQTDPESQTPGQPDTDPEAETTPGSEDTAPGGDGTNASQTDQPENSAMVTRVVNGVSFRVPQAVASHIETLETFRTETIETHRSTFVENLARTNRIAATDIETTTAWALGLSDEQYDTWATMMGGTPASALFAQHGTNPGDSQAPVSQQADDVAREIADLETIVANHRRAGMSEEKLQTKASYKRLQQLKSEN